MSFPASEAQRFVQDYLSGNDQQLVDGFKAVLYKGGPNNNPASADIVNDWLQNTAHYNTDLNGVNAQFSSEVGNNFVFWQGAYHTQSLFNGALGPIITIQGNNVLVGTTSINNPVLQNRVLSWSNSSNSTGARLELSYLTGIAPQLDPYSPSFAPPATVAQAQALASPGVPNAYIGPQFLGFVWNKGQSQPAQANIQGRLGIFPPVPSQGSGQSSSPGSPQASTLTQWADNYTVLTKSTSGDGKYQASQNTLVINANGQVTVNKNTIISPQFINGTTLQWTIDSGNSTSGKVYMLNNPTATTSDPVTGNQFCGLVWNKGDLQPTTSNWYGFVNNPSSTNGSSSQSGQNQACKGMNKWAVVDSLGNQAIQIYMQMQMGEMIMKIGSKVLSVLWDGLKAVFAKAREWYREKQARAEEAKRTAEKEAKEAKDAEIQDGEGNDSGKGQGTENEPKNGDDTNDSSKSNKVDDSNGNNQSTDGTDANQESEELENLRNENPMNPSPNQDTGNAQTRDLEPSQNDINGSVDNSGGPEGGDGTFGNDFGNPSTIEPTITGSDATFGENFGNEGATGGPGTEPDTTDSFEPFKGQDLGNDLPDLKGPGFQSGTDSGEPSGDRSVHGADDDIPEPDGLNPIKSIENVVDDPTTLVKDPAADEGLLELAV